MKAGISRLLYQMSYYDDEIIIMSSFLEDTWRPITSTKIVNIGCDNNDALVRCQTILETNARFQQSGGVHWPVN